MSKKGFLLADSLITLLIVSVMSLFCVSLFKAQLNYQIGYENYYEMMNEEYARIFAKMEKCEKCLVEEDLSQPEP